MIQKYRHQCDRVNFRDLNGRMCIALRVVLNVSLFYLAIYEVLELIKQAQKSLLKISERHSTFSTQFFYST